MLGLRTLERERIPFDLGDRLIFFRTKADFDIPELGMWNDIQKRMQQINKQREKASGDDKHAELSRRSQSACYDMIRLVLPEFPESMLKELKAGQVDHLAAMSISIAGGIYQNQSADEDQRAEIGEKFPDLPDTLIATLSRAQAWLLIPPPGNEEESHPN